MNGVLLVDKPAGLTSAEVVRRVKRRVGGKLGHLGTLDPFATGLLPLCAGEATKIAQFLNTADKQYAGVIQLGFATDTGDCAGKAIATAPIPDLSQLDLAALAARFCGEQWQTPPMYSALKQGGVPLYRLARKGVDVPREPRRIRIDHLRLECADADSLRFELACSKGTYVRVLAEAIGSAVGSAGHLRSLRRTRFGSFAIDRAAPLSTWEQPLDPERPPAGVVSIREALSDVPAVALAAGDLAGVRQGQSSLLRRLVLPERDRAVLLAPSGEVAAVIVRGPSGWSYARVLHTDSPLHRADAMVVPKVK
jgi:tRNA pseudouridine55 synthase